MLHRLLVSMLLAVIPPLTAGQRAALETARDGGDHREEAFLALVGHVAAWDGGPGDAPVRLAPDYGAMLTTPADYRGDLCRVEGRLQQRARLAPPYDVAREWFLRTDEGRPLVVYVVDPPPALASVRPGRRIRVVARFYKRVSFTARDGVRRDYPAFVGARPMIVAAGDSGIGRLWIVAVPIGVLLAAFLALLVITRRGKGPDRPHRRAHANAAEEAEPLPEDPSDALAELRRRAEE